MVDFVITLPSRQEKGVYAVVDMKLIQTEGGFIMHKYSPDQPLVYLRSQRGSRRGAVAVMVAILMVVLLGCVALAVDIGHLYVARTELQRAADSAALAGALALGRDSDDSPFGDYYTFSEEVYSQAAKYAQLNTVVGKGTVVNHNSDITIGYLSDPHDLSAPLQVVPLDQCNAVHVIARRDSSNPNGKVQLFFAPIYGINSSEVSASAIAVLDDRFYGYAPGEGGAAIPFSIDEDVWNDQIVNGNGPNEYSYDSETGDVLSSPDGTPEVKLFPEKLKGKGSETEGIGSEEDGAGNFGILHIGPGGGALGTSVIVNQITNGISGDDFVSMTGEPLIKFYHQVSGEPIVYNAVSYDILGDPGLKVGMENAMQAKIGKTVGFFLHSSVTEQGANVIFNVVGMRFGRVMEVDLTGGGKAIVIQPTAFYDSDILTSPYVPSTDKVMGRLELVR